jgi:NAD(P)-dependent dehydrogenase (short-subunit alcohol dehydrogenase family)
VTGAATYLEQQFGLAGRSALVTGASGGIGRAFALALARAGAAVAIHGRSEARLDETGSLIEEAGGRSVPLTAELADVAACRSLATRAADALGGLDILVNAAGMNVRTPLAEVAAGDFEAIMAANLRSALILSQAVHPIFKRRGGGKIVHIGSVTSTYGLGGVGVYGMSKSALAHLTKTMAVEWARDDVQVNCLAPGFILTPLTETPIWGDPERSRWLAARIPARRPGQPDELVTALLLLVSPGSSYLTGQTLFVDGGFTAGGWWEQ